MTLIDSWQYEDQAPPGSRIPASRLSSLYVSRSLKERITGLYRLLCTIEQCLHGSSDSRVSSAKLSWWLEELHAARSGAGTHPLSLRLYNSGALDAWPAPLLNRLFTLAMNRVDATGLAADTEFLDLCEAIGTIQLELECALLNLSVPRHPLVTQLTTINGQMQLLRETFWAKLANFYWVPLTLCARFNLPRQIIFSETAAPTDFQWVPMVARLALGKSNDAGLTRSTMMGIPAVWQRTNLHWLVFSFLQQRQLIKLAQRLDEQVGRGDIGSMISQVYVRDGWASWRIARLLSGGKQD